MDERNGGLKRMIAGGMLCVAGIGLGLDGGREAEMAINLILTGAAVMLMGAIVNGCGAIAYAIRNAATERPEDR